MPKGILSQKNVKQGKFMQKLKQIEHSERYRNKYNKLHVPDRNNWNKLLWIYKNN